MGVACRAADLGTRKLGRGFPSQLQLPTLIYLYLKFALRPRSCCQRQHLWFHRFHPASIPSERRRATLRRRYCCSRIVHASPARRNSSLTSLARSLALGVAGRLAVGRLWTMEYGMEIERNSITRITLIYTSSLYVCAASLFHPASCPFSLQETSTSGDRMYVVFGVVLCSSFSVIKLVFDFGAKGRPMTLFIFLNRGHLTEVW